MNIPGIIIFPPLIHNSNSKEIDISFLKQEVTRYQIYLRKKKSIIWMTSSAIIPVHPPFFVIIIFRRLFIILLFLISWIKIINWSFFIYPFFTIHQLVFFIFLFFTYLCFHHHNQPLKHKWIYLVMDGFRFGENVS